MILRIEDTDAERNKPELVQGILDGLQWLGVNWDEGPFYQSQRTDLYLAAAKKCLANGAAFLCYCPAERYAGGDHAEPGQDEEPKAGGPRRVTRCSCRDGKPSTPGVKPAVRFKVPLGGTTKFLDAVFAEREFSNEEIEDFVLLRSGKNDEEFVRTKELIEKFSLEGVSRTNAVFDRPKLEWFNTQYLQRLPIDELLSEVENELKRSGLWKPEWAAGAAPGPDGRDHAWFSKTGDLLRPRICLLPDFSSWWCAVCVTRLPRLRKYRTTFRDQVFQRRMFLAENPSSGPRLLVIVCQKSPCGRGWLRMLKQRCSAPHRV